MKFIRSLFQNTEFAYLLFFTTLILIIGSIFFQNNSLFIASSIASIIISITISINKLINFHSLIKTNQELISVLNTPLSIVSSWLSKLIHILKPKLYILILILKPKIYIIPIIAMLLCITLIIKVIYNKKADRKYPLLTQDTKGILTDKHISNGIVSTIFHDNYIKDLSVANKDSVITYNKYNLYKNILNNKNLNGEQFYYSSNNYKLSEQNEILLSNTLVVERKTDKPIRVHSLVSRDFSKNIYENIVNLSYSENKKDSSIISNIKNNRFEKLLFNETNPNYLDPLKKIKIVNLTSNLKLIKEIYKSNLNDFTEEIFKNIDHSSYALFYLHNNNLYRESENIAFNINCQEKKIKINDNTYNLDFNNIQISGSEEDPISEEDPNSEKDPNKTNHPRIIINFENNLNNTDITLFGINLPKTTLEINTLDSEYSNYSPKINIVNCKLKDLIYTSNEKTLYNLNVIESEINETYICNNLKKFLFDGCEYLLLPNKTYTPEIRFTKNIEKTESKTPKIEKDSLFNAKPIIIDTLILSSKTHVNFSQITLINNYKNHSYEITYNSTFENENIESKIRSEITAYVKKVKDAQFIFELDTQGFNHYFKFYANIFTLRGDNPNFWIMIHLLLILYCSLLIMISPKRFYAQTELDQPLSDDTIHKIIDSVILSIIVFYSISLKTISIKYKPTNSFESDKQIKDGKADYWKNYFVILCLFFIYFLGLFTTLATIKIILKIN